MEEFTGPTDSSTTEQIALFDPPPGDEATRETNLENEDGSDDPTGNHCTYCGRRVNRDDPATHEEITAWVHGAKKDSAVLRTRTGRVACGDCINKIRSGISPEHKDFETLLDEPAVTAYVGDILTDRHPDYYLGYGVGRSGSTPIADFQLALLDEPDEYTEGYSDGKAKRESVDWIKPANK